MLIAVGVTVVLWVAIVVILWIVLHVAPESARRRVTSALLRWNSSSMDLLGRAAYPWAVVMVLMFGLTLIGAVASMFFLRP